MNNEILLTIIIPVFNTGKLLKNNIGKLIKFDEKDEIEIIVVNDGSTDESLDIIKNYQKEYKNLIVISQKNLGVSSARNSGLDKAKGKFICFIDSDDKIIEPNFFDFFRLLKESVSQELLICSYYKFINNKLYKEEYKELQQNIKLKISELYWLLANQKLNEPWKKIYSREIIKKYNIKFDEKMFMGEDLCFFIDYIKHIKNFSYIDLPYYIYMINDDSACSNIRLDFLGQKQIIYNKLKDFFEKEDKLYKYENQRLFLHVITRDIQNMKKNKFSNIKIRNELVKYKINNTVKEINYISKFDKIRKFLLINGNYNLLKTLLDFSDFFKWR